MKYRVGDKIAAMVEIKTNGKQKFLTKPPHPNSEIMEKFFQVVAKDETMNHYIVLVEPEFLGAGKINTFYTANFNVPKIFLWKEFTFLPEALVTGKK